MKGPTHDIRKNTEAPRRSPETSSLGRSSAPQETTIAEPPAPLPASFNLRDVPLFPPESADRSPRPGQPASPPGAMTGPAFFDNQSSLHLGARHFVGKASKGYDPFGDRIAAATSGTLNSHIVPAPVVSRSAMPASDLVVQPKQHTSGTAAPDELEADQVANQVMTLLGQLDTPLANQPTKPAAASLKHHPGEPQAIQRRAEPARTAPIGTVVPSKMASGIMLAKGGGQALPNPLQSKMERAFGADFRGVRIHADYQAHQLNRSIQARAFTTGQDIFFKRGEYDPSSRQGQSLLAHELTHVTQQRPYLTNQGGWPSSANTIHDVVQPMTDVQYTQALYRFVLDIDTQLPLGYLDRLKLMVANPRNPDQIKDWLGVEDTDFFSDYTNLVDEIIWLIDRRSPKIEAPQKQKHVRAKTVKFKDEFSSESSDNKAPQKPSSKSSNSSKKVLSSDSKNDLLRKNSSISAMRKMKRQGSMANLAQLNDNDMAVPQGFFIASDLADMLAGLQTDGVASCTALGLADDDLNIYAFAHLDGEADIPASIDRMLERISSIGLSKAYKEPAGFHAWIGAGSPEHTYKKVLAELISRQNIIVHEGIDLAKEQSKLNLLDDNDKDQQVEKKDNPRLRQGAILNKEQYRMDHEENDKDKILKATINGPFSARQYATGRKSALPLAFKDNTLERWMPKVRTELNYFLDCFVQRLTLLNNNEQLAKEQLTAQWKNNKDTTPKDIQSTLTAVFQALQNLPDATKEKLLQFDNLLGYLEMALLSLTQYLKDKANAGPYLQGVELSLYNARTKMME